MTRMRRQSVTFTSEVRSSFRTSCKLSTGVEAFVQSYTGEQQHSGIRSGTPSARRAGHNQLCLAHRHAVYTAARQLTPCRWTRSTRNPFAMCLNARQAGRTSAANRGTSALTAFRTTILIHAVPVCIGGCASVTFPPQDRGVLETRGGPALGIEPEKGLARTLLWRHASSE